MLAGMVEARSTRRRRPPEAMNSFAQAERTGMSGIDGIVGAIWGSRWGNSLRPPLFVLAGKM